MSSYLWEHTATRYYNFLIFLILSLLRLRGRLDWAESGVFSFVFSSFFFLPLRMNSKITWWQKILFIYCSRLHALSMYYLCTVHRSLDTIYIFKNYFITIFLVFSFSNNKLNPNLPSDSLWPISHSHFLYLFSLSLSLSTSSSPSFSLC